MISAMHWLHFSPGQNVKARFRLNTATRNFYFTATSTDCKIQVLCWPQAGAVHYEKGHQAFGFSAKMDFCFAFNFSKALERRKEIGWFGD